MSGFVEVPATLFGLVQHYSPTGHEGGAAAWLVERMASLGFSRSFVDAAGNAVGVMGQGSRQVILLGHVDTVPGEIPLRVEGDRFYGRGAVDAKGALAAFVDAVAAIGEVTGWQWRVIGAVGEEGESPGALYILPRYHPEFVIVGEPSGWKNVTLGYKGSASAEIIVRRGMVHTAMQEENACEAAFGLWAKVLAWAQAYNQGRQRLFDQVSPTLRLFSSQTEAFEGWARLEVGVRLPQDVTPQDWYRQLEDLAAGQAEVQPRGLGIPAYRSEKNTPLTRAFLAAIRSVGGQPGFRLKTGTADLNLVAPAWGCPALAYGPGDSNLDHTPHEHISLEEYRYAVQVLTIVLARIAGLDAFPVE